LYETLRSKKEVKLRLRMPACVFDDVTSPVQREGLFIAVARGRGLQRYRPDMGADFEFGAGCSAV
jgi:hypothetical protein